MNTQVIFKIDKKLKDQAMKKAQNEGLPFGAVLKFATEAFVNGDFAIGFIPREELNPVARKKILRIERDIRNGKNLSPRFNSAKDAIAWLNR